MIGITCSQKNHFNEIYSLIFTLVDVSKSPVQIKYILYTPGMRE